LALADQGERLVRRLNADEFLDVGAGDEAAFRRSDDEGRRALALDRLQVRIEFLHHRARQAVGGGVRLVEDQPDDAVGVAGPAPVRRRRCSGVGHEVSL
jgi:hypothetical protein